MPCRNHFAQVRRQPILDLRTAGLDRFLRPRCTPPRDSRHCQPAARSCKERLKNSGSARPQNGSKHNAVVWTRRNMLFRQMTPETWRSTDKSSEIDVSRWRPHSSPILHRPIARLPLADHILRLSLPSAIARPPARRRGELVDGAERFPWCGHRRGNHRRPLRTA